MRVVGKGETKAGSNVGLWIRGGAGNIWSSPGTIRMGLVRVSFSDRIRLGFL